MKIEKFLAPEGKKLKLKDYKTDFTGDYTDKEDAVTDLQENIVRLTKLQDVLYAQNKHAILIIFKRWTLPGRIAQSST